MGKTPRTKCNWQKLKRRTGRLVQLLKTWKENGFNIPWSENGSIKLIRENLSGNIPTFTEWSDWDGHWVLAIGYDTRNTETFVSYFFYTGRTGGNTIKTSCIIKGITGAFL